MLAFMPQSPPSSARVPISNSTMSVAILPSQPMAYSDTPTLLRPSPAKRPKLSLDTDNVPTVFGKGSTSLRLETLSATSPTARNTFRNAHSPTEQRTSDSRVSKPALKPLSTNLSRQDFTIEQLDTQHDESALSSASASSASTIDSISSVIPYKVAYNTPSILVNGPLPRARKCFAQSKPMFPAPKKVAFRSPLTEEVKNIKFTLRHSDIDSSTSTISTLELSPSEGRPDSQVTQYETADKPEEATTKRHISPQTGDKRESSDEEEEHSGDESCPATPVAGRRKRHRQWIWTLGPIDSSNEVASNVKDPDDQRDKDAQ